MNEELIPFSEFFKELKCNFSEGTIIDQIRVDINRLYIYFCVDNLYDYVKKRNNRLKSFDDLMRYLYMLDSYYNTKLYFIAYLCNQCVFQQLYKYILPRCSAQFPGSYLLDCETSEKTIKIHFSINSIFFTVFGQFDLIYIDSDTFDKIHINYIVYNLSFFLEYDKTAKKMHVPDNVILNYKYI
jgi:hypothetical protein